MTRQSANSSNCLLHLGKRQGLSGFHILQRLHFATRPGDFDEVCLVVLTKTEYQGGVIRRIVARRRKKFAVLFQVAGHDTHPRVVCVRIPGRADEFYSEPSIRVAAIQEQPVVLLVTKQLS